MKKYFLDGVDIPHVGYGRMVGCIREALTPYVQFDPLAEAAIYAVPPDMVKGWYDGQRTACLTMWETTQVPDRYKHMLRMFDLLMVPCDWNKELFAPYHDNITVVPLGIDHDIWHPVEVTPNERFRFITGGSGWKRKGIGQVIDAFRALNLPNSELYIKCTPDLMDDPKAYEFGPNVHVIKEKMSVTDERDFYATADCFVSATRGEGFGLIPLQNAALGNLIIAPAHTGHLMFDHLFDYPLGWSYGVAGMQYFAEVGDWFVPDQEQLVESMRDAYERGRPPLWERQHRFEQTLHLSWDQTARRIMEVFPPGKTIPETEWMDAGGKKIKVRALRTAQADVGAYHLTFRAGHETEVPVSTLAHLFACGMVTEI